MTSNSDRVAARTAFIKAAGWGSARIEPFPGDASTRSYFRLHADERTAILMDAPGGAEAPACPVEADPQTRQALGYNALARLAGNNTHAFVCLSSSLTQRGFSAPQIFEVDFDAGFVLLEDLGDSLFAKALNTEAHEGTLYAAAIDTLAAIYRSSFEAEPRAFGTSWTLQAYDETALLAETELFLDWYGPEFANPVSDEQRQAWLKVWKDALAVLGTHAPGLCLRDFHAENLIWLPDRKANASVGLLDFQDALFGHPAYDLVSLIEDARRDAPERLAGPLTDRFFDAAGLADRDAFDAAAAVLAAQRNAKILGIFVRLARRDGKPKYLDLIPRVARYFVADLAHPSLSELKAMVRDIAPRVFAQGAP